jgi:hypothetical protein
LGKFLNYNVVYIFEFSLFLPRENLKGRRFLCLELEKKRLCQCPDTDKTKAHPSASTCLPKLSVGYMISALLPSPGNSHLLGVPFQLRHAVPGAGIMTSECQDLSYQLHCEG